MSASVLECLEAEPASTAQLRSRLPDGTVRSFGEIGKKVGLSSNLPPVLRELEFTGTIRRTTASTGLDHEQYLWVAGRGAVAAELEELGPWLGLPDGALLKLGEPDGARLGLLDGALLRLGILDGAELTLGARLGS